MCCSRLTLLSSLALLLASSVSLVTSECYFPVEMQGEFMTQWKDSQEIAYTSVSLTYNSVPSWGTCHRRHRQNVILRDSTSSGSDCFKCIRIIQRSVNVNQVHVRDLNRCFASEAEALADCPTRAEVTERRVEEIMLYKTRGFYGESAVTQTHCPFSGRWRFSYSNVEKTDSACASPASEAGGCPSEFMLDLKFRDCDFPDFDMSFQCLGNWVGEDGRNYLSLLDTKLPQLGEEPRPRYRCAVYQSDHRAGVTHLALSNDSTCVNQLTDHLSGYETLRLERKERRLEAAAAETSSSTNKFPAWAQGDWDKVKVRGSEFVYRSAEELTTYQAEALISPGSGRVLARISTACGDLGYACLALEHRTANIMEFKIGKIDSKLDIDLCSAQHLEAQPWVTVGRQMVRTACPLAGTFAGVIPDAEGLCATSSTSCSRPDQMEYTVYNCENTTEIYEDRLYQCFGQFSDGGLVYTFTQRLDLPVQECFVGTSLEAVGEHYVMEAGVHCSRGKQPRTDGMVMRKRADLQCDLPGETSSTVRPVNPRFSTARTASSNNNNNNAGGHRKHHIHNHRNHNNNYRNTINHRQQPEMTTEKFDLSAAAKVSQLSAVLVSLLMLFVCF